MIAKLVNKDNRKYTILASLLFVLQFVYYQFQAYLELSLANYISGIVLPLVNNPANLFKLFQVGMHAGFSILIVHLLYHDRESTLLVVWMSVILASFYVLTNLLGKYTDFFYFNIISTKVLFFIASPFKTIFSIPALKLKTDNYADSDQNDPNPAAQHIPNPSDQTAA